MSCPFSGDSESVPFPQTFTLLSLRLAVRISRRLFSPGLPPNVYDYLDSSGATKVLTCRSVLLFEFCIEQIRQAVASQDNLFVGDLIGLASVGRVRTWRELQGRIVISADRCCVDSGFAKSKLPVTHASTLRDAAPAGLGWASRAVAFSESCSTVGVSPNNPSQ